MSINHREKSSRERKLTFQYQLAVAIVFLLSMISFAAIQYVLVKQQNYASIINVSGRQRMLSQRTTMLLLHLSDINSDDQAHLLETKRELQVSVDLMEKSHRILVAGQLADGATFSMSPAVYKMYFGDPLQVDTLVTAHIATIRALLRENSGHGVSSQFFHNASQRLLSSLDAVVKQYELESNRYTSILKKIEGTVIFFTLIVLFALVRFIFRPMVRSAIENENVLNNMLDCLPVYMDIISKDGEILYQSKFLTDAIGESSIGKKCYEVYKDDRKRCQHCPLVNIIDNSDNVIEVDGCLGGRTLQVAHVNIHFRGNPAVLETFNDVTKQRHTEQLLIRAREEAENASLMKSEFLAAVSHELKTPMNAIVGLTYLALETELSSIQRDYLNKISNSAGKLITLINDLLNFSMMESNSLKLNNSHFKVSDVMDNLASIITCDALEKGLEVNFNIEPEVPTHLIGDQQRLEQVLNHLLGNAVKFTDHGHIDINTQYLDSKDGQVVIRFTVDDTGIGIDPLQINRLFQPFSQGEVASTRSHGGTGLGLASCKELVELMGGKIYFEEKEGPGSRFSCVLNFTADASLPQSHPVIPELHGLKALVVDDHAMARKTIMHMFHAFHLEAKAVASGGEALRELELAVRNGAPYDFVITDWQMPEMDGIEETRRIRENPSLFGTPSMILITAFSKTEAVQQAEKDFDGLVLKPVNRAVMLGTLLAVRQEKISGCQARAGESDILLLPGAMAGIDIKKGQAQVGGNQKIYLLLLKKFSANQAEQIDDIRTAYENGDSETLHRLLHTLRGVAANIGAFKLSNEALVMERACGGGSMMERSVFLEKIASLELALQEVLDSINRSLGIDVIVAEHSLEGLAAKEIDPAEINPIIDDLTALLKDSDTDAEMVLDKLADHLQTTSVQDKLNLLREQISLYEFDEALETVAAISLKVNM